MYIRVILFLFRMHYKKMNIEKFLNEKSFILAIFFFLTISFSRGLNCSGDPCMYGICLEDINRYINQLLSRKINKFSFFILFFIFLYYCLKEEKKIK